ncbi:hypothetical protein Pcinc_036501 [Petrolisthes cinctipes]|uniref:Uncharacterized protein n=1 Tax=Petrolisthes cinctipes TaxID=88211 RepID=A0AAE1BYF3_PETCI|nr:hypothetical protein Pcinc_036501 [Petrolisthes cinctipes]
MFLVLPLPVFPPTTTCVPRSTSLPAFVLLLPVILVTPPVLFLPPPVLCLPPPVLFLPPPVLFLPPPVFKCQPESFTWLAGWLAGSLESGSHNLGLVSCRVVRLSGVHSP